jgi:RimJ/RimL family protein N-acetyltransferase
MPEETCPFEAEQGRAFIDDAATHLATGKAIALAIAGESTDQAVGSVTLHVWGPRHWNVGYWVAADQRRHGLATEAVIKVSRWAFAANPDLARLSLYTEGSGDGGGGGIRTHEGLHLSGFQDRRIRPLCHPSGANVPWQV